MRPTRTLRMPPRTCPPRYTPANLQAPGMPRRPPRPHASPGGSASAYRRCTSPNMGPSRSTSPRRSRSGKRACCSAWSRPALRTRHHLQWGRQVGRGYARTSRPASTSGRTATTPPTTTSYNRLDRPTYRRSSCWRTVPRTTRHRAAADARSCASTCVSRHHTSSSTRRSPKRSTCSSRDSCARCSAPYPAESRSPYRHDAAPSQRHASACACRHRTTWCTASMASTR